MRSTEQPRTAAAAYASRASAVSGGEELITPRIERVHEYPPDAPRLHTIRAYLQKQLEEVDRRLAEIEKPPPPPAAGPAPAPRLTGWKIERSIGADSKPVGVHQADCRLSGKRTRPITRRDAIEAINTGIPACAFCTPDVALGVD